MLARVRVLVVGLAVCLAGCLPSPSLSTEPSPTGAAAIVDVCHPIDLRMPNGEALDLNGRWRSNHNGTYYMAHDRSCLFWMGQSAAEEDVPAGAFWTNVFSGQIISDFVVTGPWSDVPAQPDADANRGQLELGIGFFTQDGVVWPTLRLRGQEPSDVYGDTAWQPEETLSDKATFVGTIGIDQPDCPWIEVDGQRHDLTGYVGIEGSHVFGSGGSGGVGVGEQARVEGWLGQALGDEGCQSDVLLVWSLGPAT